MTIREYNECVNEHADGLFRFIVKNLNDEFEAENIVKILLRSFGLELNTSMLKRLKLIYIKLLIMK